MFLLLTLLINKIHFLLTHSATVKPIKKVLSFLKLFCWNSQLPDCTFTCELLDCHLPRHQNQPFTLQNVPESSGPIIHYQTKATLTFLVIVITLYRSAVVCATLANFLTQIKHPFQTQILRKNNIRFLNFVSGHKSDRLQQNVAVIRLFWIEA